MRLAIINITAGGLSGGYEKYLINMLPRLASHKDVEALLCIWPEGVDISGRLEMPSGTHYGSFSNQFLSLFLNVPDKKMKACLKDFAPDIIFIPADRHIRFENVPVVNMLRNMEPHVPVFKGDPLKEALKKSIQRQLSCRAVQLADQTIAVSDFVKNYLMDSLRISGEKVSLVYHGMKALPKMRIKRPATIPMNWGRNFLFTCGSVRPARGLEDLIAALYEIGTHNLDVGLVIAGRTVPGMKKYRASLDRLISLKGLTDKVCWAGVLDAEEMCWCFDRCRLFIMTSRIEACPNIAIEALSSGALCIAADNPPLPEFFSDCAIYYQSGNSISLAQAIVNGLASDSRKEYALSKLSNQRSLRFSWDLAVSETMSVLLEVLQRRNGDRKE